MKMTSKRQKILFLLIFVATLAVIILSFQYTKHPQKLDLPLTTFETTQSKKQIIEKIQPSKIEAHCETFYEDICLKLPTQDFSGGVGLSAERENTVLRIFENLIRQNPDKKIKEIDELLAQKIYTKERVNKLEKLFEHIKRLEIKFLSKIDTNIPKNKLYDRIMKVKLELPPPASIYNDEPDLLTSDNAIFTSDDTKIKIRIGGALLLGITSRYNLVFTLAHELAHSIDPCILLSEKISDAPYKNLLFCLGEKNISETEICKANNKSPEIFADFIASHVVAHIMESEIKNLDDSKIFGAIKNTVRDLCPDSPEDEDIENLSEASHPLAKERINGIFIKTPGIMRLLKCKQEENKKEKFYSISDKCFLQDLL